MEIGIVCAALLVATVLVVTLRATRPELALLLGLLAGAAVSVLAIRTLPGALDTVRALLDRAAISSDTALVLVKSLGVCLITQFTADVCRDAGESGLASRAEFAGKVALLLLALPLFQQIASLALGLMGAS